VSDGAKPKDLLLMPARLALALQADGWWVRSDIIWHKPNPMPESCTDRPTSAHEHVFLLSKRARYFFDAEAVKEEGTIPAGTLGAKGSEERFGTPGVNSRPPEYKVYSGTRNIRNVWTIPTHAYSDAHFATFPPALVERCIRAGTSERGCCAACGAPWVRQIAVSHTDAGNGNNNMKRKGGGDYEAAMSARPYEVRKLKDVETLGWAPSCQCNELRCTKCSFVLDTTDARVSSTTEEMRPMRDDIPRQEAADDLLQPGLLDDGGSDFAGSRMPVVQKDVPTQNGPHSPLFEALCVEMDGTEPLNHEGLDDNQQGLQAALSSGPSQREGGWLCDGASGGDGEEAGQASASDRGGASQERGSAGQPDRQSGANGKAGARRRAQSRLHGDLPMLQDGVPGERECPHCGSRMEWSAPNPVPCTVLDCFVGSGTTALVADRLQRHAIGIDLSIDYAAMAQRRLEADAPLFTSVPVHPVETEIADLFSAAAD